MEYLLVIQRILFFWLFYSTQADSSFPKQSPAELALGKKNQGGGVLRRRPWALNDY